MQEKYDRLEDEYKKLKEEYQNKLFELDNIPQSEIKLSAHMEELNGVLLEELKAKLLEEAANNNKEKSEMQDTIDFLQQKIKRQEQ